LVFLHNTLSPVDPTVLFFLRLGENKNPAMGRAFSMSDRKDQQKILGQPENLSSGIW
jgi:hypothetical protein